MTINAALREINKARYALTHATTPREIVAYLTRATNELYAVNLSQEIEAMRRQEYELITTALRRASAGARGTDRRDGTAIAAREIADAFAREKPNFDYHKFLRDSGVDTI